MKSAKDRLRRLSGQLSQPVSREQAVQIALQVVAAPVNAKDVVCYESAPPNCRIYQCASEPCWYILAPWDDHKDVLTICGSRVILVGKQTGVIHYDGSAGDEG